MSAKLLILSLGASVLLAWGCTPNYSGNQHEHELTEADAQEMETLSADIEETRTALKQTAEVLQSGEALDSEKLARLQMLLTNAESRIDQIAARLDDVEGGDGDHGHDEHSGHDHDGHDH